MRALSLIPLGDRPPLWREARVGLEAAALLRDPIFRGDGMTDGRGRPVLLIPGFLAGDGSLSMMAGWLQARRLPAQPGRHRGERELLRARCCRGLRSGSSGSSPSRDRRRRSSARAVAARSPRCSPAAGRISRPASLRSARRRSTRSPCIRWCGCRSRPSAAWARSGRPASSSAPASTAIAARPSGRTSPRRCRAA